MYTSASVSERDVVHALASLRPTNAFVYNVMCHRDTAVASTGVYVPNKALYTFEHMAI